MKFYQSNMRLLKKKNKRLYDEISSYHKSDKVQIIEGIQSDVLARVKDLKNDLTFIVEESRREGYTLKAIDKEKKEVYFHSKYSPKMEADGLVKKLNISKDDKIIAFGFGLGYHLSSLVNKGSFDKILIIEPYLSVFYTALLYIDISNILRDKSLTLLVADEENIFPVVRNYHEITLHKKIKIFEHPPSINLFSDTYKVLYEKVKDAISFNNIDMATKIKSSRKWRNNAIKNLPYIIQSPKADDFFSSLEDIPAICVSAGPSLDKNIDKLKEAKGKALILCVGTALKALLKAGIEPDIVVTMDGKKANYKHFKDIKGLKDTYLFTEKANHYLINREWGGRQVYFTMKRNLSRWLEGMCGEYTPIKTGGTVAHSMVDLAYRFGANPIVLVGQDLAYSEGRTHATGTTYEGKNADDKKLYEVESINGEVVFTSKVFKSFLIYFNEYFYNRPDRLYIDATEGGAKIDHTKVMDLEKVIDKYCKGSHDVGRIFDDIYNAKKKEKINHDEYEKEIDITIKELESAVNIIELNFEEIIDMEEKLERSNFNDRMISKAKSMMRDYENRLNRLNRVRYFTQLTLIIESLKYKQVSNKFYIDKKDKFKNRMKYYKIYLDRYLKEVKVSLSLLKENYNEEIIEKD